MRARLINVRFFGRTRHISIPVSKQAGKEKEKENLCLSKVKWLRKFMLIINEVKLYRIALCHYHRNRQNYLWKLSYDRSISFFKLNPLSFLLRHCSMCRGIGTLWPGSEHMEAINARRQTCRDNSSTDTHTQKRMKHHQQRWW